MGKSPLLNRQAVRRYLLDYAARSRSHVFTRVAPEAFERLDAGLREQCRRLVHTQPSAGKTIR